MGYIDDIRQRVVTQVLAVEEMEKGYSFTFASEDQIYYDLEEFVNHESRCCTFLDFAVQRELEEIKVHVTVNQFDLERAKEIARTLFSD